VTVGIGTCIFRGTVVETRREADDASVLEVAACQNSNSQDVRKLQLAATWIEEQPFFALSQHRPQQQRAGSFRVFTVTVTAWWS
jgi:hypothetical protein